jgi:hypothetical protein
MSTDVMSAPTITSRYSLPVRGASWKTGILIGEVWHAEFVKELLVVTQAFVHTLSHSVSLKYLYPVIFPTSPVLKGYL